MAARWPQDGVVVDMSSLKTIHEIRRRSRRGRCRRDVEERVRGNAGARADAAGAHQLSRPVRRRHACRRRHRRNIVALRHADRSGAGARRRDRRRAGIEVLAGNQPGPVRCHQRRTGPVRHHHARHAAAGCARRNGCAATSCSIAIWLRSLRISAACWPPTASISCRARSFPTARAAGAISSRRPFTTAARLPTTGPFLPACRTIAMPPSSPT